ncbi:UNVERIFIED_CONTAM: hypothetical protein HDU68_004048 [Siphonaria sp. JEL0065]|nr:hypothetical protein HDU68_004048 [Siphonaria sp. JEL0065]
MSKLELYKSASGFLEALGETHWGPYGNFKLVKEGDGWWDDWIEEWRAFQKSRVKVTRHMEALSRFHAYTVSWIQSFITAPLGAELFTTTTFEKITRNLASVFALDKLNDFLMQWLEFKVAFDCANYKCPPFTHDFRKHCVFGPHEKYYGSDVVQHHHLFSAFKVRDATSAGRFLTVKLYEIDEKTGYDHFGEGDQWRLDLIDENNNIITPLHFRRFHTARYLCCGEAEEDDWVLVQSDGFMRIKSVFEPSLLLHDSLIDRLGVTDLVEDGYSPEHLVYVLLSICIASAGGYIGSGLQDFLSKHLEMKRKNSLEEKVAILANLPKERRVSQRDGFFVVDTVTEQEWNYFAAILEDSDDGWE